MCDTLQIGCELIRNEYIIRSSQTAFVLMQSTVPYTARHTALIWTVF